MIKKNIWGLLLKAIGMTYVGFNIAIWSKVAKCIDRVVLVQKLIVKTETLSPAVRVRYENERVCCIPM